MHIKGINFLMTSFIATCSHFYRWESSWTLSFLSHWKVLQTILCCCKAKWKKTQPYTLNIWELYFIPICRNKWETKISQKSFGFISWLLKEGLCVSSWLPTSQSPEIQISVCVSCTAWAGIAQWQDLHTQAIPRASLMSLSNNSEKKGEAEAWNSSLIQFQDHFLKAEAAAAFWSETSIAGACPKKKCNKYA